MIQPTVRLPLPRGFRVPDLGSVAEQAIEVREAAQHLTTAYYDTADLRLTRWGCSLRYRPGCGWIVKTPIEREPAARARRSYVFEGGPRCPPLQAVDLLSAYLRGAPVQEVARLRTDRRMLTLHAEDGTPLAEAVDDRVALFQDGRAAGRFREAKVRTRNGAPAHLLEAIVGRLRSAGALPPTSVPKIVRVLDAPARQPPEVVVDDDLPSDDSAGAVLRRAFALAVVRLLRHDPAVRASLDAEAVHQMRVSVRRFRSLLRTFRPLLDSAWAVKLREELRWLARHLGAVRDADVMLERLRADVAALQPKDRIAAAKIIALLANERESAAAGLLQAIREDRYFALIERLIAAARRPELAPIGEEPAVVVLRPLVAARWRRLQGRVSSLGDDQSDGQLHRLRIQTKHCRYAAETLAPVAGKRARRFARRAADLQQTLGEQHDAVVAQAWLRRVAADAGLAFVAGKIAALESVAARAARARWPDKWRALNKKKLSSWM